MNKEVKAAKSAAGGGSKSNVFKYVAVVLGVLLLGLGGVVAYMYFGRPYSKPDNIRVTNVTDRSVTISWKTEKEMPGVVVYSEEDDFMPWLLSGMNKKKAYDDRDVSKARLEEAEKLVEGGEDGEVEGVSTIDEVEVTDLGRYYVHHVTVTNLEPETDYYFMIGNGYRYEKATDYVKVDQFSMLGEDADKFTTYAELDDIRVPNPSYGGVVDADMEKVTDAITFMYTDGNSPVSGVLNEDGKWYIDLSNIRAASGESYAEFSESSDSALLYVMADVDKVSDIISNPMSEDAPVGDIVVRSGDESDESSRMVNIVNANIVVQKNPWNSDDDPKKDEESDGGIKKYSNSDGGDKNAGDKNWPVDPRPKQEPPTNPGSHPVTGPYDNVDGTEDGYSDVGTSTKDGTRDPVDPRTGPYDNVGETEDGYSDVGTSTKDGTRDPVDPRTGPYDNVVYTEDGYSDVGTSTKDGTRDPVDPRTGPYDNVGEAEDGYSDVGTSTKDGTKDPVDPRTGPYDNVDGTEDGYSDVGTSTKDGNYFDTCSSFSDDSVGRSCTTKNGNPGVCIEGSCNAIRDPYPSVKDICRRNTSTEGMSCVTFDNRPGVCVNNSNNNNICREVEYVERFGDGDSDYTNICSRSTSTESTVCTTSSGEFGTCDSNGNCIESRSGGAGQTYTNLCSRNTSEEGDPCITANGESGLCNATGSCILLNSGNECVDSSGNPEPEGTPCGYVGAGSYCNGDGTCVNESQREGVEGEGAHIVPCGPGDPRIAPGLGDRYEENDGYWEILPGTECPVEYPPAVRDSCPCDTVCPSGERVICVAGGKCGCGKGSDGTVVIPVTESDTSETGMKFTGSVLAATQNYTVTDNFIVNPDQDGVYSVNIPGVGTYDNLRLLEDKKYAFFVDDNGNGVYEKGEELVEASGNPIELTLDDTKEVFTLDLVEGLNFVSLNHLSTETDSCKLIEQMNKESNAMITQLARFESGKFQVTSYREDMEDPVSGECFPVVPGRGYVLRSFGDEKVALDGYALTKPADVSFDTEGWHLIGVNGTTTVYTAESLIDDVNEVEGLTADNITHWLREASKYEGLQKEEGNVYGFDYAVNSDEGYFVRVSEGSGVWSPEE